MRSSESTAKAVSASALGCTVQTSDTPSLLLDSVSLADRDYGILRVPTSRCRRDAMLTTPGDAGGEVLDALADVALSLRLDHPVRVAVEGRSAAGKTTFADALAEEIRARGRAVL